MAVSNASFWQKFHHRAGTLPARYHREVIQQRLKGFFTLHGLGNEEAFLLAAQEQPQLWTQLHQALMTVASPPAPTAAGIQALREALPLLASPVPDEHPFRVLIVGQGDLGWAQLFPLLLQETLFPDPGQAWEVLAIDASYAAVSRARQLGAPAHWWKTLPLDASPLEFNAAGLLQPEPSLAQRLQFLTYDLLLSPPLRHFHLAILLDEAQCLTPQALTTLAQNLGGSLEKDGALWAPALAGSSPPGLRPVPGLPQAWQARTPFPPAPRPNRPSPATPNVQQKLFAFTQDTLQLGHWQYQVDTQTLLLSPQASALYGLEPQERNLDRETWLAFIHPEDRTVAIESWQETMAQQTQAAIEYRIIRADGEIRWHRSYLTHENGSVDQAPSFLLGFNQDVTSQKNLSQEVDQSQSSYQALIEASPFPIVIHAEDRFLYANRATLNLLGLESLTVLQATPPLNMLPAEEISAAREMIRKVMEGHVMSQPMKHLIRLPNRQTKQVEMVGMRINYQGKSAIQLVMYDLTQQKVAEQEVRELNRQLESRIKARTRALEHSNHELERFAFSVSHDLRAPLRHLISYTSLLERRAKDQLTPETLDFLHFISAAANKMNLLIENLLTYSRIGRKTLTQHRIDVDELMAEIRNVLVATPAASPIQWKIGELPSLYGDPILIEQVFMNLLSNAIKYSSREAAPQIEIGGRQQADSTLYWIKDNGVGFENDQREHIFGIFRRLFSEAEFEGTGIGLANVRRIMDRHEGKVWAQGTPEQGATFFLRFPSKPTAEPDE